MGLSSVSDIAVSGLAANSDRASVVSRNISNANDPNATRKIAHVTMLQGGQVRVAAVTRDVDQALMRVVQTSLSDSARAGTVLDGLNDLQAAFGEPNDGISPAAVLGRLRDDLSLFAASPDNLGAGARAVATAKEMAATLNDATRTVQGVRAGVDREIASGVDRLNTLLMRFDEVNREIVEGSRIGRDITDHEDQRASLLGEMSELIGVRTITRADNDMVVMTEAGVTLFEVSPRRVAFEATPAFGPGVAGAPIFVDGLPLSGVRGAQSHVSGSLAGLLEVRDELAPTIQAQLDEMARGLIVQFAESDQTGGAAPTRPGLFTYDLDPAMPGPGLVAGLAGRISVAASVDPDVGGDVTLLRDGSIGNPGDPAYRYNALGGAAYADRLIALADGLAAPLAFDPVAGLPGASGLTAFASDSYAWMQEQRRQAETAATQSSAAHDRAAASLTRQSGVNLDEEMALMLEIERAYQATARLMSSVNSMFDSLFAAVR